MQDLETIATEIASTVRFRQSVDANAPTLDNALILPSDAKRVYHPLLTNINMAAICPLAEKDGTEFNSWLTDLRMETARSLYLDVMRMKKNERYTKEMLDNLTLYSGTGRLNDFITKQGRLVGFEIELLNSTNINVVLEKIMTHFDSAENFPLYLFHSSAPGALTPTATMNHTTANQVSWHDSGAELKYEDFAANISGGTYYLMYDEDDITGQAIDMKVNFGYVPCRSCDKSFRGRYEKFSKYVRIQTVAVSQAKKPAAGVMFDLQDLQYVPNTTWGLNLALSSYCDLTDYVVAHKTIFADAMDKQMVNVLLKELIASTRSNVISEKMKDNARFSLQNAELGGENFVRMAEKARDAVGFELSNIQNSVCMPKIAAKGIKYGAVTNGKSTQGSYSNGYY